ncbi:MAG: (4Fe-4S)-binding protein [Betaproteobacteria bacterium]|nr:MAG: (4Fe-4S)-binding protein [Betaproteobacteria bacterium]
MNVDVSSKTVKEIIADIDKCTGCRACEMACSAFHAMPRYSSINPARSRIRVVADELNDEYVPVRAGNFTRTGCDGRHVYQLKGKKYSECSFCPASCPTRDFFIEPDSGLPLKCDMCEDEPPLAEPLCVTVCEPGCLTYAVRQVEAEVDAPAEREAMARGLASLVNQHGIEAVIENLKRVSKGQ